MTVIEDPMPNESTDANSSKISRYAALANYQKHTTKEDFVAVTPMEVAEVLIPPSRSKDTSVLTGFDFELSPKRVISKNKRCH